MNRHRIILAGLAFGLTCPAAFAASAASQIAVTATVAPTACITEMGEVKLGTIAHADLDTEDDTTLRPVPARLLVRCVGPTKIAVTFADNLPDSVSTPGSSNFGLGKSGANGDVNNGYYTMTLTDYSLDSSGTNHLMTRPKGSDDWGPARSLQINPDMAYGLALSSSSDYPDLGTTHLFGFDVRATIAKGLAGSDEIALNGDATIDLEYL